MRRFAGGFAGQICGTAVFGILAWANCAGALADERSIKENPNREAYYGDLHLHTSFSFDAYIFGSRITPDEAYRFARGEPVEYEGHSVQRRSPLDFLAVTDHSENIGVSRRIDDPSSAFARSETGKRVHWAYSIGAKEGAKVFMDVEFEKDYQQLDLGAAKSAWQAEIDAANRNYRPGKFTTFIAYEWSPMVEVRYHLHRNVIFKGDTAPFPFSAIDSKKPEDLWSYLESNRQRGIEALAVPHNPNLSNGLMYGWNDSEGRPIDEGYAQRRAYNEPLSEISQPKGQSETLPALSPNDEFAGFEQPGTLNSAVHGGYVREAYGRGLVIAKDTGVNPFKFGVVGASDLHTGLSLSEAEPFGDMMKTMAVTYKGLFPEYSEYGQATGSLTGVWAERNTRDSIYAALRRKETFATSGTRLKFRLFGGWQFPQDLFREGDWVKAAYTRGVPMGGDLPARPRKSEAPQFAVWALKDPVSGNLDRIQIVKVWLAGKDYGEQVFDVAYSDHRQPEANTGRVPPVGDTVDTRTATYSNTIGSTELHAIWRDPRFDPAVPAVYYLRVLEIPTPRWSTIQAIKAGGPLPSDVPASVQQRGWSSPIWYSPGK